MALSKGFTPPDDPAELLEDEYCRIDMAMRSVLEAYAHTHHWQACEITSVSRSGYLEFGWRCPNHSMLDGGELTRSIRVNLCMTHNDGMWLEYVDESRTGAEREWDTGSADRHLAQSLANVSGLRVWVKDGAEYTLYPLETAYPIAADASTVAGSAPDPLDEGARSEIAPAGTM